MSRSIVSPVKRWPGTITLPDYLTFPQLIAYGRAMDAARLIQQSDGKWSDWISAVLPGVLACVQTWNLTGFPEVVTAESFPATPLASIRKLTLFLLEEINRLNEDSDADPNG